MEYSETVISLLQYKTKGSFMKFLKSIMTVVAFLMIQQLSARSRGGAAPAAPVVVPAAPVVPVARPAVMPAAKPAQPAKIQPAVPAKQPVALQSAPEQLVKIGRTRITIVRGDITQQKVDAIINAANEDLSHGGGVAAAISRAAGPELQKYSNAMPLMPGGKRCPTGKAVITPAFNLENVGIKKIIHTTGPLGSNPNKEQLLRDAYTSSLKVAQDNGLKSVAFPSISTAIFGYDINEATPVAFAAVKDFIKSNSRNPLDEVRFVVFSDNALEVYKKYAYLLRKR
jgi:O-acetyl-ADP-ribose deacetylase